uniref:DUF7343 domain-containing protein n=1 Tax=Ignisphaera aggregans TaxID=334771 RepID=A0A7J3JN05_9CREN
MAGMAPELSQRILDLLSSNPSGIPQSHIHRALGVSKAYVSIILKDMERRGVIYRDKVGNSYIVKLATKPSQIGRKLKLGIVWSSEYLFLGHFAKALRNVLGLDLAITVYPSALQATSAIIRGEIDAVLSPLVTQLYAYISTKSIVIVGGGAGGGAMIYEFPRSRSNILISSEASSMDLCRVAALKKGAIEQEDVRYFATPSEAIETIRRGKARYAVLWHPLTEYVKSIDHSKVVECSEFEELKYCCTLATSGNMDIETVKRISIVYRDSIEEFLKQPLRYLDWYSSITGIDTTLLKKALNVYTYTPEIDARSVWRVIETLNLNVPQKSSVIKAILSHF